MTNAYAHRYPNNLSFDIVGLLLTDDGDSDFMFYAGRMGKTSDYLPEVLSVDLIDGDEMAYPTEVACYTTPNVTIEKSYYSIEYSKDDNLAMNYTFDKDNRLTGIETERAFAVMKTTYKVVVGNELIIPEVPERGYKYEQKDYKTVKEKDDADIYTWTIDY